MAAATIGVVISTPWERHGMCSGAGMRMWFDKGTLRFQADCQGELELATRLPGMRFDPRTNAYRAPPWLYSDIRAGAKAAGLSLCDLTPRRSTVGQWADVGLRSYQRAAVCAWELAGRRGLVILPTGSGKTRVAVAAMAALRVPTLCLVPTRVLLHQWQQAIAEHYGGAIGCWGDGERRRNAIMVTTFESAYRQMPLLGGDFRLLVVDEAHHFGVGRRDEALEMAIAPWRLGLTATPPQDETAEGRLGELIGPTVYRQAVDALAGTFLAEFKIVVLPLELERAERAAYEQEMALFRQVHRAFRNSNPGGRFSAFAAMAASSKEVRAALAALRRAQRVIGFTKNKARMLSALLDRHQNSRVLIFTADNTTTYAIAREHLVTPLTCDIHRAEREEVLERFREGQIRSLVSAKVLNEGIDVPDAAVAIIVGGSSREREHIQRIGRLLRPSPGKQAVIYELLAAGTNEVHHGERRRKNVGSRRIASLPVTRWRNPAPLPDRTRPPMVARVAR